MWKLCCLLSGLEDQPNLPSQLMYMYMYMYFHMWDVYMYLRLRSTVS